MRNKIFDSNPDTWQDLEIMLRQAFDEMGYESYRNRTVKTVRGTVKFDVFAKKETNPIPSIVVCECKYWNTHVSQNVIHGFRTVCADIGAHYGLIVSKNGFQSGAEESRDSTNIHLMTFDEFQDTFFGEWKTGVMMMLSCMRDEILPIMRAKLGNKVYGLDRIDGRQLQNVDPMKKYSIFFGWEGSYSKYFITGEKFPVEIFDPRGKPEKVERVVVNSHREYLEIAKQAVLDARTHFGFEPTYFENFERITPIYKGKSPPPMD